MAKTISQWECKPCEDLSRSEKNIEVCMICTVPSSKGKVKVIKKEGKQLISKVRE